MPTALGLLLAAAGLAAAADIRLTPGQEQVLQRARSEALEASLDAEAKLVDMFSQPFFRFLLGSLQGSHELVRLPPQVLLDTLKANMASLEYTINFGLDAKSRQHTQSEGMDLDAVEKYGHMPTDWELKLHGDPVVANVSWKQWKIYDAAETGLYGFPEFADPDHPTLAEALERPKYIAGNMRRMDMALQRYGAYAGVLRNQVVRDRAVLIGSDSGGWQGLCNKSVVPLRPSDRSLTNRLLVQCAPMVASKGGRPVLGLADHQMHTLLTNAQTFDRVDGNLARLLHQFLTPGTTVRPIEVNMYTEAVVLGALRVADLKVLVGSFPGLFGTSEGEALRAFCKRHQLPLAWGLGGGQMWPDEAAKKGLLVPYEPLYFWPAGHARLLDPVAGWPATNGTAPADPGNAWGRLWTEVAAYRKGAEVRQEVIGKEKFESWWAALEAASGPVPPLRAGDCGSADLCFGTHRSAGGAADCVCRAAAPAAEAAVLV